MLTDANMEKNKTYYGIYSDDIDSQNLLFMSLKGAEEEAKGILQDLLKDPDSMLETEEVISIFITEVKAISRITAETKPVFKTEDWSI
jgi:hypothetical protein